MEFNPQVIEDLKKKVEKAESHVNHLEGMASKGYLPVGLDIPSINELRYAFHHLLRYLTGDINGANDALKHVNRAIYDCYETESLYQFANFRDFETSNQDILMKDVFPDYLKWAGEFAALQDFINNTPKDIRERYYSELESILARVRPFATQVFGARQEILKLREEKERQKIQEDEKFRTSQEALKITQENLSLANKTIKIRNRAIFISCVSCLMAIVGVVLLLLKR